MSLPGVGPKIANLVRLPQTPGGPCFPAGVWSDSVPVYVHLSSWEHFPHGQVMSISFGRDAGIVVDTHVHRFSRRIGWVQHPGSRTLTVRVLPRLS